MTPKIGIADVDQSSQTAGEAFIKRLALRTQGRESVSGPEVDSLQELPPCSNSMSPLHDEQRHSSLPALRLHPTELMT